MHGMTILSITIPAVLVVIAYLMGRVGVVAEVRRKEEKTRSLKVITHDLEPGSERQTALAISISPLEETVGAAFSVTLRGIGLAERGMWHIVALGHGVNRSWGDPADAQLGFRVPAHDSCFIILRIMGYADLLIRLRIDSLPDDMELDVSKLPCYLSDTECELELGENGISIVTRGATAGSPKIILFQGSRNSTDDIYELGKLIDIDRPRIGHRVHDRMVELDGLAAATLAELMAYIRDHRGRGPTMIATALTKYLEGDTATAMSAVRAILRGADEEEVRQIMGIERLNHKKRLSRRSEVKE